ncbi:MAG: recombination protein NinG [Patescibacteria group bacterium]|nr:recombination protein NinG [Patescibacteria group bacterium]
MTKAKARLAHQTAKKKTWTEFSKYIRTRDCLQSTGRSYYGKCFTCGRITEFAYLQAGHFISGRNGSILFDERGCHAQCAYCNTGLDGNKRAYEKKMQQLYDLETIDKLRILAGQVRKYSVGELEQLAIYYREKTTELINGN